MRFRSSALLLFLLSAGAVMGCKSESPQPQADSSLPAEWEDSNQLHPGPIRHPTLTDAQVQRIKTLQQTFRDVDPMPLEKWLEDFKRDLNPEREIRIYEVMAKAYRDYSAGKKLTQQAKEDVFQVVLLRSGAPESEVLPRLKLKTLSLDDAKEILQHYNTAPVPVTVSP